mmetsp:Transcript_6290/g.20511  ORF Transcript_6290/g.20511 Transcript_6290/m.20511 type:complete len:267 (+) Transcript_6290:319-1119(+)
MALDAARRGPVPASAPMGVLFGADAAELDDEPNPRSSRFHRFFVLARMSDSPPAAGAPVPAADEVAGVATPKAAGDKVCAGADADANGSPKEAVAGDGDAWAANGSPNDGCWAGAAGADANGSTSKREEEAAAAADDGADDGADEEPKGSKGSAAAAGGSSKGEKSAGEAAAALFALAPPAFFLPPALPAPDAALGRATGAGASSEEESDESDESESESDSDDESDDDSTGFGFFFLVDDDAFVAVVALSSFQLPGGGADSEPNPP